MSDTVRLGSFSIAALVIGAQLLVFPSLKADDPPPPPEIRPSYPSNAQATATDLANPSNAWDNNPYTSSSALMIKHCKEYCTTPETRTTTFSGFPAGWIPRRIEVKWRATSAFAMYSNSAHGEVRAKIEYSLDGGGSWDILGDEFISTDTAVMPNMTEQYYGEDVSGAADSDQVQVRATLTVRMSSCPNCTTSISHVGGQISVSDIRLQVQPPELVAEPAGPVERGTAVTFRVRGAPTGQASGWTYTADNVGLITRANSNAHTWAGVMVDSGTAKVTVTLSGVTYPLERRLEVTPRDFALPHVSHTQVTGRSITCVGVTYVLPVPVVQQPRALGRYCLEIAVQRTPARVNDDGPNHDVRFVQAVTNGSTNFRWIVNPDLLDETCQFYVQQTGTYPSNPTGYISGLNLQINAIRHESGPAYSHYAMYVAANAHHEHNIGIGIEGMLAPPLTSSDSFLATVDLEIATRRNLILAATDSPEPYGATQDSLGNFQGFINYTTYVSCNP
jgi:hypothetical protein